MVVAGVTRAGGEISKTPRNTSWRPARTGGLVPQDGLKGLVELDIAVLTFLGEHR